MMQWITQYIEQFQYVAIAFVLFLAGLGIPIPEDIPLIYGGVMAGKGSLNVYIHFIVSMVFIIVGDVSLYLIGRRIARSGKGAEHTNYETPSRIQKILTPERKAKVQTYFDQYGSWAVFLGRFVAGVRGAVYLTAGMTRFPLGRFIFLDFLAALVSVPLWIWLGYWAGENWMSLLDQFKEYQVYVLGALCGLVVIILGWRALKKTSTPE